MKTKPSSGWVTRKSSDDMLFEMTKQQDMVMHNLSGEMGVKTSLYLVFVAFIISASLQVMNLSKNSYALEGRSAMLLSGIGAGIALFSGLCLLIAAVVRDYSIFPVSDMADWLKKMEEFRQTHPNKPIDSSSGLMLTLIRTVDENQVMNERKALWIERGTWLLFAALPFTAIGALFAIKGIL